MLSRELQEKIYRHTNMADKITDDELVDIIRHLDEAHLDAYNEYLEVAAEKPNWAGQEKYVAARYMRRQYAEQEAARLGYAPHPEVSFNHSTCCLVREAQGEQAGMALAAEFGFRYKAPNCMWDNLDHRRYGNAILALIGDDRGWDKDWMYWIVVEWQPLWLAEKYDFDGWVS